MAEPSSDAGSSRLWSKCAAQSATSGAWLLNASGKVFARKSSPFQVSLIRLPSTLAAPTRSSLLAFTASAPSLRKS